jgi:hypothetical protein
LRMNKIAEQYNIPLDVLLSEIYYKSKNIKLKYFFDKLQNHIINYKNAITQIFTCNKI